MKLKSVLMFLSLLCASKYVSAQYYPDVLSYTLSGNVGIGTTSPGNYMLAVEGTVGARKVDVKQTSWADFVFKPDYQLPLLSEVESYIHTNQHLPGIPSEAEVKQDGIDLREMNKKTLTKSGGINTLYPMPFS